MRTRSTGMMAGAATAVILGCAGPSAAQDAAALTQALPPALQTLYAGAPQALASSAYDSFTPPLPWR